MRFIAVLQNWLASKFEKIFAQFNKIFVIGFTILYLILQKKYKYFFIVIVFSAAAAVGPWNMTWIVNAITSLIRRLLPQCPQSVENSQDCYANISEHSSPHASDTEGA